jgi:hypothetical protein
MQTIRLDMMLQWLITQRLALRGGLSVGYRFGERFTTVDRIDGAGGYRFPGGELERSIFGAQTLTLSPLSLSTLVSSAYSIPLSNKILLEPELSLRYDILSSVNEGNWQTLSLGVGLGLSLDLSRSTVPKEPPVPVAQSSAELPSRISASIEIFSLDQNSQPQLKATVFVHDRVERYLVPILPWIRFDSTSVAIPSWYIRRTAHEANSFTLDSLGDEDAVDVQRHILDVLGLRLRENPSAHLQLNSPTFADEFLPHALQQAEAVRNYLTETWGIERERLEISEKVFARHGSTGNKDVVEIVSNDPGITAPVETMRILQLSAPPVIRLKPEYHAASGVKRWQITVSHEGKRLARYSSDANDIASDSGDAWTIPHRHSDQVLEPIVAELVVEDSTGAIATARDRMPLTIEQAGEGAVEQVVCLLFPFISGSQTLTEELSTQLHTLIPMIRNGAHITIQSFAQAVERSDSGLAERRAAVAKNALQAALSERSLHNVTIDIVNSKSEMNQEVFEPALQRRVEITVEQSASDK